MMENYGEMGEALLNTGNYQILKRNCDRVCSQASSAAEKSFAHLLEIADLIASEILKETGERDILHAVLHTDNAAHIYREMFSMAETENRFAEINAGEEPFFKKEVGRFAALYLCRSIAKKGMPHTFSDLNTLFFGFSTESTNVTDKKIAFLRNRQAFLAFERFAKTLGGVSVLYENNFQNACEAVAAEQATYAIIPIYSTSDGRLNSFYRMIEKYELNIILTCDVDSDDGESMTTFALVYKDRICLHTGSPKFECKITFDDLTAVSDIADAAYYYGARLDSLEALPMMFSGRAGTFSAVFDLTDADIDGLICYLALEYPQMSVVGIYGKT
jgi:hypothetical protein